MKQFSLTIIFTLYSITLFAQHTEKFLEITKNLKRTEVSKLNFYHKNNQLYYSVETYIYEINNKKLAFHFGERIYYTNLGKIIRRINFDDFGNVLKEIQYDKDGRIIKEVNALKIDFKTEINNNTNLTFDDISTLHYESVYKYSRKLKQLYLKEEGMLLNKVRIGKWIFFNANGEIKKEKNYN